jgi:type VI secretion system protein ImpA
MRYDFVTEPISDADPCGPDLDELGDDQYLNYMLGTDNRLPKRFLDPETNAPFDRAQIDLKAETKAIGEFLEQTRDLRLLTLEARFQALAGQVGAFSECVQAIAALLGTYWEEVHPRGYEGDFTMRQNTVGVLDDRTTVVLPLQYAPIIRDQRIGTISLFDYMVATGSAQAREGQATLDINHILDTMRSDAHRATLDELHASLGLCKAAVSKICNTFDEATDYTYTPDLDVLRGVLGDLSKLIESARPDLGPGDGSRGQDEAEPADADSGAQDGDVPAAPRKAASGATVAAPTGAITSTTAAAQALLAVEAYFGRAEPSSPTLILVHQARLLVGQPLVAALDALLPDNAEYASMVIDSTVGFAFTMAKMRAITDDYTSTTEVYAETPDETPAFEVGSRAQAMSLLASVASYFRAAEPSSPIPMLIARAERFGSQSFQSILTDLMPRPSSE